MATPVADLQARISELLGSMVGDEDLESTALLADINQVHRFDIPTQVGGGRFRAQIAVTVPASTASRVDLNTATVTPSGVFGAIVGTWARTRPAGATNSTGMTVYTDASAFRRDYDPALTDEVAIPQAILIEGMAFTLRPIPSVEQTVYLDALAYREALGQNDSITLDFEAKAIVFLAAGYASIRLADDDVTARMREFGNEQLDVLRGLESRSAHVPIAVGNRF